jgi:sulfite exporter TauE/SafE
VFNLGRVSGFGLLGAALGGLGGAFQLNARFLAVAMVAVALFMGALGLKLTGLSPKLSRFSITLPSSWTKRFGRAESSRVYRDSTTWLLGAASFFLPCGFTQAVQVFALASGDAWRAGLVMAAFALGTTPGLLGLGAVGALPARASTARVFHLVGVAVCVFAGINLVGAAQILYPTSFTRAPVELATVRSDNVVDDAGTQVLKTVQNSGGYSPEVSTVYRGVPVRWEIESESLGCASIINLEAMGLGMSRLQVGSNVFEFTPTEVGSLPYTCGMGMYAARIDVIEPPGQSGPDPG